MPLIPAAVIPLPHIPVLVQASGMLSSAALLYVSHLDPGLSTAGSGTLSHEKPAPTSCHIRISLHVWSLEPQLGDLGGIYHGGWGCEGRTGLRRATLWGVPGKGAVVLGAQACGPWGRRKDAPLCPCLVSVCARGASCSHLSVDEHRRVTCPVCTERRRGKCSHRGRAIAT